MSTEISASMVKSLRETTGVGMMECKKALVECGGDFDKARDLLRVKSGAKADKVAGRQATEGRVAYALSDSVGVMVEVSCETDFVARDDHLISYADAVAQAICATSGDTPDIGTLSLADGTTVEEARRGLVMKLGENLSVRRTETIRCDNGEHLAVYRHTGDKIAALCAYSGADETLAREVCMHIAAMRPRYVDESNIPPEVLEHEKGIFRAQAEETGKTGDMAEKIAAGKLKKFVAETTLLNQPFVKDGEKTVGALLSAAGMTVLDFRLMIVGEGE